MVKVWTRPSHDRQRSSRSAAGGEVNVVLPMMDWIGPSSALEIWHPWLAGRVNSVKAPCSEVTPIRHEALSSLSAGVLVPYFWFSMVAFFLAGCSSLEREDARKIDSCNRPEIESAMRAAYSTSTSRIGEIAHRIDYRKFTETCAGKAEVRTPISNWPWGGTRPEISLPLNAEYKISKTMGVCIVRTASVESAGVYANCYR